MFDLRYHVASLAAVFLALIIGILVGVGIASQTSVSESDRQLLEQRISDLQRDLEASRNGADLLRRQQEAGTRYIEESYPAVMNGRLRGIHVALLFIGQVDSKLRSALVQTLADASGPPLARMRALQLPIDAAAVTAGIPSDGNPTLEEVGRRLGREFAGTGDTPYWDALAPVIVQDSQGPSQREAEAIVVAQTEALDGAPTNRLVSGVYAGLNASGVPVVGVARTDQQPQRIAVYRARGLSSVDAVDAQVGRSALAVLLAGGEEGHYGLNTDADGVVPPIEPLRLAPPPGG
ncbi:MAG TPA: copper transporter [Gaiellaceae bacterium]|nr:copper transporter [Gaiellaceae bacterium]